MKREQDSLEVALSSHIKSTHRHPGVSRCFGTLVPKRTNVMYHAATAAQEINKTECGQCNGS